MNGAGEETDSAMASDKPLQVEAVDEEVFVERAVQRAHRRALDAVQEALGEARKRYRSALDSVDAHRQGAEEPVSVVQAPGGRQWGRVRQLGRKVAALERVVREMEADVEDDEGAVNDAEHGEEEAAVASRALAEVDGEAQDGSLSIPDTAVPSTPKSSSPDDAAASDVLVDAALRMPGTTYRRLFDYQFDAVRWLWQLHCQRTGGILGDEMGLGKTVQIIAFLAALHYSGRLDGPTLIVTPVTVLAQWCRELHDWWPQATPHVFHATLGSANTLPSAHRRGGVGQVLLTSYEQLRRQADRLLPVRWAYAILDEGHRIRNVDADITRVCKQLRSEHRIVLSGAPLQNRLQELWSLFDFVFPGRLGTLPAFEEQFCIPISMGGFANATPVQVQLAYRCAAVLKDLIAPYLLRRLKKNVSVQLPPKRDQVLFCPLTSGQRELYRAYLDALDMERVLSGDVNLLPIITTLRKICNHPVLLRLEERARLQRSSTTSVSPSSSCGELSGKMRVLEQLLRELLAGGHRVLLFSQTRSMLNVLERFVRQRGYTHLRMDGETEVAVRAHLVHEFNHNADVQLFLLTTRVGGLGLNLTGADRVVIYDPDWNPSVDLQARERAWRIGQQRPVAVYRLVTRGTIEEKIYHRQIFKYFLSEKVLHDPRKRRFFQHREIRDLLTLEEAEEMEETPRRAQHRRDDVDDMDTGRGDTAPGKANAAVSLVQAVLAGKNERQARAALQTVDYDETLQRSGQVPLTPYDRFVVQQEASRLADMAVMELRKSVTRPSGAGAATPEATITETSRRTRASIGPAATMAHAASPATPNSAILLQRMRERAGADRPRAQLHQTQQLLERLVTLVGSADDAQPATTACIVRAMRGFLQERGLRPADLKETLRRVATFEAAAAIDDAEGVWRLRPAFRRGAEHRP